MVYLQTRSTSEDYDFFGHKTASWWATSYGQFTVLENFTVLWETDPSQSWKWRIYIGGIPSNRKDRFGRPIQYALAGDGTGDTAKQDAEFFHRGLYFLLDPYSGDVFERKGKLLEWGKELDQQFSQAYIDGLDKARHTDEVKSDVRSKLETAGKVLPELQENSAAIRLDKPSAYIIKNNTVEQFLSRAKELKQSDKAMKLGILNLPPTESEIQEFWKQTPGIVSLLLFPGDGLTVKDPVKGLLFELLEEKKTPLQESAVPQKKSSMNPLVIAVIALVVIVILFLIIGGRK